MFGGSYVKLGKLFGIPFGVAPSFLILFGFLALFYTAWLPIYAIIFASVTVHEFGHAFAARRLGIGTDYIVLHVLGGAAMVKLNYQNTLNKKRWFKTEFLMAGAGPATSMLLCLLGLALWELGAVNYWLAWFIQINFIVAVFNLIPIFPADGGRLLRSGLTRWVGFRKATDVTRWVARVLLLATCAWALASGFYLYLIVGGFLLVMGEMEAAAGIYRYDVLTGKTDDIY